MTLLQQYIEKIRAMSTSELLLESARLQDELDKYERIMSKLSAIDRKYAVATHIKKDAHMMQLEEVRKELGNRDTW